MAEMPFSTIQLYCAHRYLYSFPTRRSSDLPGGREPVHVDADLGDHDLSGPLGHSREDRKSTRLNSSHANISYAVFCLKKKTRVHCMPSVFTPPHRSSPQSPRSRV